MGRDIVAIDTLPKAVFESQLEKQISAVGRCGRRTQIAYFHTCHCEFPVFACRPASTPLFGGSRFAAAIMAGAAQNRVNRKA